MNIRPASRADRAIAGVREAAKLVSDEVAVLCRALANSFDPKLTTDPRNI
jgi:hypothetical protein